MISDFDDYPIHQTTEPINQPASGDRNHYDRYWFNGFDRDANFTFEIGFGIYPNRLVQDAHFSASVGGVQHSFHGSRRAPRERADASVGPLRLHVEVPMRRVRVVLEPNETGLECDLTFEARSHPLQEPKNVMQDDGRQMMETTRFTQLGRWSGSFKVNGHGVDVRPEVTLGTRDRSWGIRPVGEPPGGAPSQSRGEPGVYWCWSPVQFDDFTTQCGTFEDFDGNPTQASAAIVPLFASVDAIPAQDPGHEEMARYTHEIDWEPGTRRSRAARFRFEARDGDVAQITLEPRLRFQLLGIGYQHPEWAHGVWHDELSIAGESWKLDDIDPLDFKHIHVHQVCEATLTSPKRGEHRGMGILETIVFGRHARSGFESLLDGAK